MRESTGHLPESELQPEPDICLHEWVLWERQEVHVSLQYPRYRRDFEELWYCRLCRHEDTRTIEGTVWMRGVVLGEMWE